MKTLTYILFFLITLQISVAQDKGGIAEHLTFKGVPINGTLNEYVSKMKNVGFTHVFTEDGTAILKGDFAGFKNCGIGVSTLKQKDLVSKIGVIFPENVTWSSLSTNYFNLKDLLTEKYGEPSEVVEEFNSRLKPRDDNDKMHQVKMDRCSFYSIFSSDKGEIQLSINHDGLSSCFVRLVYTDKINSEIIRKKALNDL